MLVEADSKRAAMLREGIKPSPAKARPRNRLASII
jgi:hypothetical protein